MLGSLPRILVVDDDAVAQDVACRMLHKLGALAEGANSGQNALELVRKATFDLIFLDWELPDMTGLEVARFLRETLGPLVPLVGLSGYSFEETAEAGDMALFSSFLVKPARMADFEQLLTDFKLLG